MRVSHAPASAAPGRKRERGAIVLITGLSMTCLLIITSIVVDLGSLRVSKRNLQNVADVGALAAGYHLSGHGNAMVVADPRGACNAALRSIKANLRTMPSTAALACSTLAASAEPPDCTSSTPMQTVTSTGSGAFTIKVGYPVPDAVIRDPAMLEGTGWNDGQPCTRMRIEVSRAQTGTFSALVGQRDLNASASAVVRGGVNTQNGAVPALLMLDRTGCQTIVNSSNGNGNLGIIVRRVSDAQGGHIHTDSDASQCGTTSTSYTIYGSANSNGEPSIQVENGANGILGAISSYATAIGSLRGAAVYPSGINQPGTAGPVVGRLPFDRQFNPTPRPAISDLHSRAYAAVTMSAAAASANGYTVVGCNADGTISGAKVYVNCANYAPAGAFFNNASRVVFNGQVTVGSGKWINLPSVNDVWVRGCPACTGGNFYAISISGGWYQNIGNNAIASAECTSRLGPGAGGSTTNTSVLVTFGSPFLVTGQARMCQTTYYQGANTPTYVRQATTTGPPNCSNALPCPIPTGAAKGGSYAVSGDYVEWTAPNQLTTISDSTNPFEDLAYWSESSDLSEIKSGGVMRTSGIFFSPNASVAYRSPALGSPRNAQFVARSLQLLQGTLVLQPVSSDAVRVPLPGGYGLIR